MNAWKWSRNLVLFWAQLPWPNIQFTLWVCDHLLAPLSFCQYPCLFELDACLWVFSSPFLWMLILLFLETSTISCCMNFYLALESREYSHINVGWIQVGDSNVWSFIVRLLWGWEEEREKKKKWKIKIRKRKKKKMKKIWKKNKKSME